jgi:hypothetical protein
MLILIFLCEKPYFWYANYIMHPRLHIPHHFCSDVSFDLFSLLCWVGLSGPFSFRVPPNKILLIAVLIPRIVVRDKVCMFLIIHIILLDY